MKSAHRLGHNNSHTATDCYARKLNARDLAEIAEMNRAIDAGEDPTMEEWLERCDRVAGSVENGKMRAKM